MLWEEEEDSLLILIIYKSSWFSLLKIIGNQGDVAISLINHCSSLLIDWPNILLLWFRFIFLCAEIWRKKIYLGHFQNSYCSIKNVCEEFPQFEAVHVLIISKFCVCLPIQIWPTWNTKPLKPIDSLSSKFQHSSMIFLVVYC